MSHLTTHAPIFRGERIDYEVLFHNLYGNDGPILIDLARLGDFDGDGSQDLLAITDPCGGSYYAAIHLVHLVEGGGIGPVVTTPVSSSCAFALNTGPEDSITLGDFDRDGRLDVAFWRTQTLYRMTPGGSFTASPISLPLDPTEGFEEGSDQLSADMNGDGIPDVVVSQSFVVIDFVNFDIRANTNLYVFLADGHGGFLRSQKITASAEPSLNFSFDSVALLDFNGDDRIDLLVEGSGPLGRWEVLTGDGAGHISLPVSGIPVSAVVPFPEFTDQRGHPAVVGDLNGDHLPDLVFGPYYGPGSKLEFDVFLGTAPGMFGVPQKLIAQVPALPNELPKAAILDANGDGWMDLEVYGPNWVYAYLQHEDGTFLPTPTRSLGVEAKGAFALRWDEDGLVDRVYFGYPADSYDYPPTHPSLSVLLNHGSLNRDFVDLDLLGERNGLSAVPGDFDGDGHQDVAIGSWSGILLYLGDGRGGFRREVGLAPNSRFLFASMIPGDWNGDGRTDLVVLNPSQSGTGGPGSFTLYLSQPHSTPRFLPSVTLPVGPNPMKAVAVDLNGDHQLDLLVGGKGKSFPNLTGLLDGTAYSYLGNGHGGFAPSVPAYTLPDGYLNPEFADVEAGDVDADGLSDLLVLARGYDWSAAYWGKGHGDGTFEIPSFFGTVGSSQPDPLLKPEDLNGDGFPDFLLAPVYFSGHYSAVNGTFLGTREGDFRFQFPSDCCEFSGRFVDLDGDGFLDLFGPARMDSLRLGAGTGTGEFLHTGPNYVPTGNRVIFSTTYPYGPSLSHFYTDFDEDGREDLVILDDTAHLRVTFNRSNRIASDGAESLQELTAASHAVDPQIDLVELQGRVGSYDFAGSGTPQGALVLTMSINRWDQPDPPAELDATGGLLDRMDGNIPAGPSTGSNRIRTGAERNSAPPAPPAKLKSGTFQLFLNFGEPLKDSNHDGTLDLSLANARQEPGLAGIPLADVTLTLRLDGGGPPFSGLHDINKFSWVDQDRGIATFIVPFDQLLSSLTPAERAAMDQGDGTARLFVWAVSRLYGDQDRMPDTDDGGEPTIHSEVREFRFPLTDLRATPYLTFDDLRIGRHLEGPLTLANHGVKPADIDSVELPASTLTLPLSAPFRVPPVGRLQIPARFSPTEHAPLSGEIEIHGTPQDASIGVPVYGRGVAPILRVTPMNLDFGSLPQGFISPGRSVQVANVGDDWLEGSWELKDALQQFGFNGYVPPPGPHPLELYPGQSNPFVLSFTPTGVGGAEGIFEILSDDALLPKADVLLKGIATPPEPRIVMDGYPSPYTISDAPIGGQGSAIFLIRNTGSAPLEIHDVVVDNSLFTTSLGSSTIAPKDLTLLTVTYHPVTWGQVSATLTLTTNDPTTPSLTRTVSGKAFEPPPQAQIAPTVLDFGALHQGASATLSFAIKNLGGGPLRLSGYSPLLSPLCAAQTDLILPATILPGEALTANVTYTADIDKYSCNIYFNTNDTAFYSVTIQILAQILSPVIGLSSYTLQFPNAMVGGSSTLHVMALNFGADNLIISGMTSLYSSTFSLITPLPVVVAPGETADLQFSFTPTVFGYTYSTLVLQTNDLNHRQLYLNASGFGLQPFAVKPLTDPGSD